jgi:hypothetical protein
MPDGHGGAQATQEDRAALELWGGIEPTHNRVGDRYYSQLDRSGHHARLTDLDRCAELGIRTLRYPVLWERTMPEPGKEPDWKWSDERLTRLRELGITPIVGLLHHGSGPLHTSLVDPHFADKFADYAMRVASRYPWLDHYTPVNEPLTTALFSGLYGVWYPHGRSDRAFTTALLAQCRAVVLAMRAIRATNPQAKLVQTDDLGATYSTPLLRDQACFNNERTMACVGFALRDGRSPSRALELADRLRRRARGGSDVVRRAQVSTRSHRCQSLRDERTLHHRGSRRLRCSLPRRQRSTPLRRRRRPYAVSRGRPAYVRCLRRRGRAIDCLLR